VSYIAKPVARHPKMPVNALGLTMRDYEGTMSTLCAGCGHDSITNALIKALFEMGVEPHLVAKLSGIGCSSKTTAYFLSRSHGFNAVHGRMGAIAAGVNLANRALVNIGVSGDGDTASIGMGNFLHMVRRNVPIVYIIENNGCYGLTKGQFSATADKGSTSKGGAPNVMPPIDCCALAIEMGCGYVARSFSGDPKQLQALLKGALAHNGTALLDVISPCVTFNDHEGSTKSYKYVRANKQALHDIDFVPFFEEITVDYEPGTATTVEMHDGSKITLKKLDGDYDASDRWAALKTCFEDAGNPIFYTGLLYLDESQPAMDEQLDLPDEPLATLPAERTRPSREALAKVNAMFT
jgi:2-oxoglutarate ferredoxin oxidoreductase subunit beta